MTSVHAPGLPRMHEGGAKVGKPEFRTGLIAGCLLLTLSLVSEAWMRQRLGINFIFQLLVPGFICLRLTRDWLDTLTLLTISDICLNGASIFFEEAGFPGGRSYFFVATMGLFLFRYLASQGTARSPEKMPSLNPWILFYAIIVPSFFIFYSVLVRGTALSKTIDDMHFIAPLLFYFPLRRILNRQEGFFIGWMIALSITLSLLALTISLAPLEIGQLIIDNMNDGLPSFSLSEGLSEEMLGIQRGGSVTFIITYIGFFFGMLWCVDFTKGVRVRILGTLLCALCISHLCVDYLRGPLLSTVCILLITFLAVLLKKPMRHIAPRLFVLIVAVVAFGIAIMTMIVPEGIKYFSNDSDSVSEYMGSTRREIAPVMLAAFHERPWMGQGVGVPPPGYTQLSGEGALKFELSYHIVLYRVGLIGFLIFMVPLAHLYGELLRRRGALGGLAFFSPQGKFRLALLLSALTTTIAGITNPYLKTGYLMIIIATYWATTHHLKA